MTYLQRQSTGRAPQSTDGETVAGDVHPAQALRDYRRASGVDAHLVETATPQLISDFPRVAL